MGPLLKDKNWVRQSFLVRKEDLEKVDQQNRTFTSASLKFTDTTPGGNFAINPPPQFTRYADIRAMGRFVGNQRDDGSAGMGRYYSEAIDDSSQVIHLRFGVPQFNSTTQFFTSFYNSGAGRLARTGRADGAFYLIGKAAGMIVPLMSFKILAVHLLGIGLNFALAKPTSKFYYLKPTMPLYWSAVTTMVNQMAVNRGIIPRVGGDATKTVDGTGDQDLSVISKHLNDMLPDIFQRNGGIDVYAMANRAQRLARKHHKRMQEKLNNAGSISTAQLAKILHDTETSKLSDTRPSFNDGFSDKGSVTSYMGKWLNGTAQSSPTGSGGTGDGVEKALDKTNTDGFGKFLLAELDDGGAFVSFRVNSTGPASESFSNQAGDSDLQGKINGMSASSRSTSFSLSGGNTTEMIGGIVNAVKDFAGGVGDALQISGLAALGGAAFVDIPKHWQSSVAQLSRASYTINLVSPYGNPISQMLNLYVPLAMLLAGALPLSTGKQSYTSPFICELYDQGRCQTRLGMIDSMQITRGTGNFGFNSDGHAMGIDVTFSVVDLSSIMHMPISQGFNWNAAKVGVNVGAGVGGLAGALGGGIPGAIAGSAAGGAVGGTVGAVVDAGAAVVQSINDIFAEDTAFTDYMNVIAGMGLADQIYQSRKLMLNLTKVGAAWSSFTNASTLASFAGDTIPGRLASVVFKGVAR
jgi:hypothetical protein